MTAAEAAAAETERKAKRTFAEVVREEHLGPCKAWSPGGACPRACEAFEYKEHQDGFRLCACGHTQNSHTKL